MTAGPTPFLTEAAAALTAPVPVVPLTAFEALAREAYGLDATAGLLPGERDRNARLVAADGRRFLMKAINPGEDPAVTAFQSEALRHLAAVDPDLPVPRLVPTTEGAPHAVLTDADGASLTVRVTTFLAGRPLAAAPADAPLRAAIGTLLARVDRTLAGVAHPGAKRPLLWDVSALPRLRPLLDHVAAGAGRTHVEAALARFEAEAAPRLPGLRRQVVHNDLNPSNILLAERGNDLAGLIDFGDMLEAPLVQDLAVASAYHVGLEGPPLAPVGDLVAAFHRDLPLTQAEIALLPVLILGRLALTLLVASWRAQLQPENSLYILRNAGRAETALARLLALSPDEAEAALRTALRGAAP